MNDLFALIDELFDALELMDIERIITALDELQGWRVKNARKFEQIQRTAWT